jgi:hypothetical protein
MKFWFEIRNITKPLKITPSLKKNTKMFLLFMSSKLVSKYNPELIVIIRNITEIFVNFE